MVRSAAQRLRLCMLGSSIPPSSHSIRRRRKAVGHPACRDAACEGTHRIAYFVHSISAASPGGSRAIERLELTLMLAKSDLCTNALPLSEEADKAETSRVIETLISQHQ